MEPHVLNEADKFIQFFIEPRLESGEGLDTITPLSLAATNILVNTLTGNSYDYDDPKAHDHLNLIHEEHKHNVTFAASIPFTKWIPGDPFHSAEAERNYSETFKKILSNFDNIVAKRRRELQDGCSPNLMLDHMLLQYRPELGDQERFGKYCICIDKFHHLFQLQRRANNISVSNYIISEICQSFSPFSSLFLSPSFSFFLISLYLMVFLLSIFLFVCLSSVCLSVCLSD